MSPLKTALLLVFGALLFCSALFAQGSTAQITGTVTDATGATVPGAEVKVTQTATGASRTANSGADGGYVLPNLPIGPYVLEVTKDGFSKYVQTGIVLQVNSNPSIDAALKLGAVSDQVTVEADAAMVETHSTGIGQVVDSQRVTEMPLNGRNPIELVFLAGMASTAGGASNLNSVRNYPTVIVSVAGGQGNAITYLLDGANHQDPNNSASLPLPFPDALQEFKVETSALPAQYGFHSGAAVNAVTKSGTNEIHGDLFEFLRNGNLNARNAFARVRDTLKRNQYGGTVGAPIIKNKLFVFGGFQRTNQRSDPAATTAFVPTAAMAAGDFTGLASPACNNGRQITLTGSNNNIFAASRINPVALNLQKLMPVTADPCGRTTYGLRANQDENLTVARVDWQKSDKHTLFARVISADLTVGSTFDGSNPLTVSQYGVHDQAHSLAIGDTYLFGAGVVNSFRFAANRTVVPKVRDNFKSLRELGADVSDFGEHVFSMTVTNAFSIGGGAAVPGESHNGPNPSFNEDLSWVKGNHQFGFGGSILRQGMNYWSGLVMAATSTFNGSATGLSLADLMTGQAVSFNQGLRYGWYNRQYYSALYAQDTWKITPRLTLSYGIRWEPYTAPWSKFGQFNHFDADLYTSNFRSSIFKNAPAGLAFSGEQQYACGKSLNCSQWSKFFPRIGLVWDPKGDGKMTVRAAVGQFGDRNHMFFSTFMSQYAPYANNVQLANVNLSTPWAGYPGGNPLPALDAKNGIGNADVNTSFPLFSTYVAHPTSNYHAPVLNQWNVSVQRQVGTDWLLTVNYIGNSTIHLQTSNSLNPGLIVGTPSATCPATPALTVPTCSSTANLNQRRRFYVQNPANGQYYSGMGYTDDGGTGSYNALFFSAQKRLSHGVSVLTNYTWAHCISDQFDAQPSAAAISSVPGDRRRYRSNCANSDLRQLFNLSAVATMPKFSNKAMRLLASGWQISPILSIRSSQFFTVVNGTDRALSGSLASGTTGQTPNLVSSDVYPAEQTMNRWINPSAFSLPALGTYGNLGQNNIKGPGVFQLNLGVSRTFPVWGEKRTLQLRAESFNFPNHLNPSTPVSSVGAGNFGQITSDISGNNGLSSGNPRIVQVALKFVF